MKSRLLTFIVFFISFCAKSQNQNSVWCFGDSAGIDFRNITHPDPINTSMDGIGSCVSIADTLGNLLFYVNTVVDSAGYGGRVWNRQNQLMDNGDSIAAEGYYNELIIIPMPGSDSLYYLLSAQVGITTYAGLYCSVIDMSQNGGLGKVIQKNILFSGYAPCDYLAAVKHANGRDWWLVTRAWDSDYIFYEYLITPYGITSTDIQPLYVDYYAEEGTLTFSKDGNKILYTYENQVQLGNFDRCTGQLNNWMLVEYYPPYSGTTQGSAFSPNGNLIYVSVISSDTSNSGSQSYLFQYDLTAPNIDSSRDTIFIFTNTTQKYQAGALRLAPDNKIYMATAWNTNNDPFYQRTNYPYSDSMRAFFNENLSVINSPDSLGAACNFTPYSFYLGGKRTYWGLPNNPDYEMGALRGSPCDTILNTVANLQKNNLGVSVYPNPNNGDFTILFKQAIGNGKVEVFNMLGEKVGLTPGPSPREKGEEAVHLDVPAGVYLLKVSDGERQWFEKVIVE